MDFVVQFKRAGSYLKKYGYVVLILVLGVLLMVLPTGRQTNETQSQTVEVLPDQVGLEQRLGEILSQIHGAGKVRVLLTVAEGERILYQTNEQIRTGGDSADTKIDTVILTGENRGQQGLVQQVNPPSYLGAVVVCQGAESAVVRLAIMEAVADATGLTMDKISVLKMK